ncbi:hypothetical protein BDZ94DRAFT_1255957 [Collybia nuda]|uniref:Uncharacterized protein n=1 Tax=Collybia nuda TaxID=64659 RepID=A0A9P5Y9A9_9AGAR|nr:hypothetical protein BDZ94DRAFT_1255957 [Collybia nuda]
MTSQGLRIYDLSLMASVIFFVCIMETACSYNRNFSINLYSFALIIVSGAFKDSPADLQPLITSIHCCQKGEANRYINRQGLRECVSSGARLDWSQSSHLKCQVISVIYIWVRNISLDILTDVALTGLGNKDTTLWPPMRPYETLGPFSVKNNVRISLKRSLRRISRAALVGLPT